MKNKALKKKLDRYKKDKKSKPGDMLTKMSPKKRAAIMGMC